MRNFLLIFLLMFSFSSPAWAILGAEKGLEKHNPSVVLVHVKGVTTCSGIIVTSTVVLTAAHCFKSNSPYGVSVSSVHMYNNNKMPASDVVRHPRYPNNFSDYDIAIVRLILPLPQVNDASSALKTAKLTLKIPPIGEKITAQGFGWSPLPEIETPRKNDQLSVLNKENFLRLICHPLAVATSTILVKSYLTRHALFLKQNNASKKPDNSPKAGVYGQLNATTLEILRHDKFLLSSGSFSQTLRGICFGDSGGGAFFQGKLIAINVGFDSAINHSYPNCGSALSIPLKKHHKWINKTMSKWREKAIWLN